MNIITSDFGFIALLPIIGKVKKLQNKKIVINNGYKKYVHITT